MTQAHSQPYAILKASIYVDVQWKQGYGFTELHELSLRHSPSQSFMRSLTVFANSALVEESASMQNQPR